jgi:hypothetical protein
MPDSIREVVQRHTMDYLSGRCDNGAFSIELIAR